MAERIDIKVFQKEAKRRERKEKFENGVRKVKDFAVNNKETAALIATATIGTLGTAIKAVSKHSSQRKEKELKDFYCYDRSLGHYWKLRRELSNSEWLEIDRRKKNGECLSDILDELKLLK